MIPVTIVNILALLISFLGKLLKQPSKLFFFAILILIIFYGIRTDYGNDIPVYKNWFDQIYLLKFIDIIKSEGRLEFGWIILNYIFFPLGWQSFIVFLTVVQISTVYLLIKKYIDPKYYWLFLALYLFNANLFLTELSMLRQSLAMSICVWSIRYLIQDKLIKFIILILIASTIHTSAFIVLILYPVRLMIRLDDKILVLSFLIIFFMFYVLNSLVGDIIGFILNMKTFEQYGIYNDGETATGTGLVVLFQVMSFAWMLMSRKSSRRLSPLCAR